MDGMIDPPAPQVQPLPRLNSRHVAGDGHQVVSARDHKAADGESGLLRTVNQPFDLAAQLFLVVHHGIHDTHAQPCILGTVFADQCYQSCGNGVAGIDLGLGTFAAIAHPDGTHRKVQAPEPFRRSMKALRRAQRKLSRRQPGSGNRAKARLAVAWRHRRMADIRKDFLHNELTAEVAVIQVEGLPLKGWQRRWGRKTSDLAPAEFVRQMEYKSQWRGDGFLVLPWHFPSSQVCHECGARGGKLPLEVRRWTCRSCGVVLDRDVNAARNIRDFRPGATGRLPVEVNGKTR